MQHYLIVGGSRGIGLAITQMLVSAGHQVTIWSRQPAVIPGATGIIQDVTQLPFNCDDLPEVIDGIVYCPGSIQLKPFARMGNDDFKRDWEINFLGAVNVLQAVFPRLKKSPMASVVLFSSVAVGRGMSFHASIASAKGAVEALVRALAAEWAPNVRVNALAPSLTQTSLSEKLLATPEKIAAAAQRHPLKIIAQPEDIAAAAVFLLSPGAKFITGQILPVDGGLSSLQTG